MERVWTRIQQLVWEDDMDADELIDDYLTEHIDMVNDEKEDWEYHTDPRDGEETQKLGRALQTLGHIRWA